MIDHVFFTGGLLDRADVLRGDPARLAEAMADPMARVLELDGLDPVLDDDGGLRWRPVSDAQPLILLGLHDGIAHFVAVPTAPTNGRARGAIDGITALRPADAALYAAARSLADWHARHGFCAVCGGRTTLAKGGWMRDCTGCGAEHFPRVDPVVIMLAEHADGEQVLLGRSHGFAPGRLSALAGFVEPGESIEEAAARELFEEAGIRMRDVRYVASQPWPFAASLMIACIGRAENSAIVIDATEIDEARWVARADVARALAGEAGASFDPPPRHAIARVLLERWAARLI